MKLKAPPLRASVAAAANLETLLATTPRLSAVSVPPGFTVMVAVVMALMVPLPPKPLLPKVSVPPLTLTAPVVRLSAA